MSLLQSIILGVIQGLTEFLPISSSGHLAICKYIFGLEETGIFFDILLHVGTLIAVFAVYYRDIWELIVNAFGIIGAVFHNLGVFFKRFGKSFEEKEELLYSPVLSTPHRRFVLLIIVSSIPVGIVGFLFDDFIEGVSKGLLVPGICFLITGILLLLAEIVDAGQKGLKNITFPNAIVIGIAQACAVFPGISRSGATISTSLMCGIKNEIAVKYSFILSIPVILGAALKSSLDVIQGEVEISGSVGIYAAGAVVAAIVGYAAIRLLLVIVKKRKFKYFAFYCFAIGLVSIVGSFFI
ncbi:MAG: undecaprenyl-diphosphate phosphatase [Lachnospiraceae bacterium]|jgi:undecaprenyl-diphosphatase